jgi:MoaA/NifB/PqqE/SkfB family radical SAM enzyme
MGQVVSVTGRPAKLLSMAPVGARHLESSIRDALYVVSHGRLDTTKPHRFYGILNDRCNLRCRSCPAWRLDQYPVELPSAEWIRVLGEIRDYVGAFYINFAGGEPLLKEGLFDILNYCRDNQILAGITSNGAILRDRQATQLVDARVFSLNLSLDGATAATHDHLRGSRGSFDRVLRTIALMQAHADREHVKLPLVVKATVSRPNLHEMTDLVRLATDVGASGVLFQPLSDWGTPELPEMWIDDMSALDATVATLVDMKRAGHAILNTEEEIQDWPRHFRGESTVANDGWVQCWVGITTLRIDADGSVSHCGPLDQIGHVRDQSIAEIWEGETARQRRLESTVCTRGCGLSCTKHRSIRREITGAVHFLQR